MSMRIKGLSDVRNRLKQAEQNATATKRRALTRIGALIKRDAVKRAPVDTGNLRSSAYTEVEGGKLVRVGFSAFYAAWVHEMVGQKLKGQPRADFGKTRGGESFGGGSGKGNYWDSGEPKFLENAVKENRQRILDELAGNIKL